jgi:Histidine kinase-, DNA gyrase B-, and HSP90-like ATPase
MTSPKLALATISPARDAVSADQDWMAAPAEIVVGKDVLELLSTSMYVDPMTIYREYMQNAADAIDEARAQGLLPLAELGRVTIETDAAARSIRIRDNGTGIPWSRFARQLTSVGASAKRGSTARGFRGVGRLAGLGYCQEVIFRARSSAETLISELRWDCRRLQASLRSSDFKGGLAEVVHDAVSIRRAPAEGYPERFFEVELRGVIRHRNDRLLSPPAIAEYLAQVAPLPFDPAFSFGSEIAATLDQHVSVGNLHLTVAGIDGPVYRPHGDRFEIGDDAHDAFTALEPIEIAGVDGGIAAVGWLLHHGYTGAIPAKAGVKGLRLRVGNVQVGEGNLLEELFPEPRFNAWAVGEIHILDQRIVPNGRRDHFQANVHFSNVLNHLSPTIRDLARRCRTSSIRRKWLREFELQHIAAREKLAILKQGTLATKDREQIAGTVRRGLVAMTKITAMDELGFNDETHLKPTVDALARDLEKALGSKTPAAPLAHLPPAKRKMYEHLFALIYDCSTNQVAAKALIDRILRKIA